MKKELLEILTNKKTFPTKLTKREGENLKNFFKKDESFQKKSVDRKKVNDLEFRYIYQEDGVTYILLEEFIFKEGETLLTLENSIGVDYYFNKI
jgi:hypothetical protein